MIRKSIELLKKIRFVLEEHPFLTSANIISFILAFFPALCILIFFEIENKSESLFYMLPFWVVYIVSSVMSLIFTKFPKIGAILSFLINSFLIFYVQFLLGIYFFYIAYCNNFETKYNKIENYPKVLQYLTTERVAHFPDKIPTDAKNIYFQTGLISFFGNEDIYLKFDTTSEYIDEELKKYAYVRIIPYKDVKFEDHYYMTPKIKLDDYMLYVIKDRVHDKTLKREPSSFFYHYGIAVNRKDNQILYYYADLD